MTHSQNSQPDPERNPQPRRSLWLRILLVGGGIGLIGLAAAGWWAWRFIQQQLAPLVAENLSKTFDRPVEVGPVEAVGLSQLTFGQSAIPATPTDPDRATLESVKVRFNLLELLWDRTLSLDVTLVQPEVYLAQDKNGLWITTKIQQSDEEEGPIKIELDTLRIQEGTAQLAAYGGVETSKPVEPDNQSDRPPNDENAPETLPRSQAPDSIVGLNDINGTVTFRDNNQRIAYDVRAQPDSGGNVQVQGVTNLEASETTLQLNSHDLLASELNLLVPLPLKLQEGKLASNLKVAFPPNNQPLQFYGSAQLKNVVALVDGAPKPVQADGKLQFQGQRITFQQFQGRYGAIPARISGSLDTQAGYDLQVQVPRASVTDILSTIDLKQSDLPIAVDGAFQAKVNVTGGINQPLIKGTVQNLQPVQVDRLRFRQTQAAFTVTPQAVVVNQFEALPQNGGRIVANGRVKFGNQSGLVVDVRASNLPGDAIARAYGANTTNFAIGNVDATAQVFGPLNNVQTVVQWQAPQATYPGRGRIVLAGSNARFEDTALLVAGGIVRGNGQINQGRWQANLNTSGIKLSQFNPDLRGLFSGDFQLAGRLDNLDPSAIQAAGQVRFSEGLAIITDPLEASVRWLGDRLQIVQATARNFRADGFILAQLTGPGAPAVGGVDVNVDLRNYRLADLPVAVPSQIQLAGTTDFNGRITGPLAAISVAGQLGLNKFAVNSFAFEPRLAGNVRYDLNRGLDLDLRGQQDRIAVVLDDRNRPRSFYVQQGEAVAEGRGNGDQLVATLRNFPLYALNLSPAATVGFGAVSGHLNGRIQANIADLSNPDVAGTIAIVDPGLGGLNTRLPRPGDETTQICSPTFVQAVQYVNPEFVAVPSADRPCPRSLFVGQFSYRNGVARLAENSQLLFGSSRYVLSGVYDPQAETAFQGKVVAQPGRIEDIFALLNWSDVADLGRIGGPLDIPETAIAPFAVDVQNKSLLNQLRRYAEIRSLYRQQVIARQDSSLFPTLDTLQGGFTGEIDLAYSAQAGPTVQFDLGGQDWAWGSCSTADNVRSTAQETEETNSATTGTDPSSSEPAISAAAPPEPFLADQPPESQPESATRRSSAAQVAQADLSLDRPPARCQRYDVDQVIAKGSFEDGVLTLLPVTLQAGNSLLTFSGQVGGAEQSGQLIAQNIPVAALRDLFRSPIDITGNLNATATLGGSVDNPQFEGEVNLVEGQITQVRDGNPEIETIPPVRGLFGYNDARLNFDTRFVAAEPTSSPPVSPTENPTENRNSNRVATAADDNFQFTGSIPYKLPFAKVEPDNYQLSLDLNLSNDRLALINLLTDQVSWEGGEGNVQLQVRGNLPPDRLDFRALSASGTATFANAQIGAKALPEDLTNVNGTVLFERDRLRVSETVTGQLGNGQVTVAGVLPLQTPLWFEDSDAANPLTVNLDNLTIELAELYDGDVNGFVQIAGAALAPVIRGEITLSNGRILIPTPTAEVAATPTAATATPFTRSNNFFSPPAYDGLRVTLGDRLRVTYDPVLSFLVRGDLQVSGTQPDPLLDGTVALRSGQVNLFTTQFNLERGYNNRAVFDAARGLDPILDVHLVTSVPEVTRFPNTATAVFPSSEIVDTPSAGDFGAIQTVRVQAIATGPASQVFQNLELTSSPRRSETEILALLGGIGNLQGSATTALASLAGSSLLTGLQNLVIDNLGLTDFRLFPTTIISKDNRTTNLALAAELGFDITNDFSVSVLQLLTTQSSPQFSLRYRLTDELLLRGSTNLEGDSRAVLEFETRF